MLRSLLARTLLIVTVGVGLGVLVLGILRAAESPPDYGRPVLHDPDGDGYEVWAVVRSDSTAYKGPKYHKTCRTDPRFRHVVSPDATWYIIPDAYDEWAAAVIEGETVVLPATIRSWRTASSWQDPDKKGNRFLPLTGDREYTNWTDKEDGQKWLHTRKGITFFVKVEDN